MENIKHFSESNYPDRLQIMFEKQKDYQKKSGNGEFPRLDGEAVSTFALGMVSEIGEVLQEYKGWKPWKNSDCYTNNRDKCLLELADVVNFFINMVLALDFDHDDLYEAFQKKHEELEARL